MSPILFYATDKPYGEFSNFSRHPIDVDGVVWPTSEHYFQAQKFAGTSHVEGCGRSRRRCWPRRWGGGVTCRSGRTGTP